MLTNYGDISPRTAGHAARELLERGAPALVSEQFGQTKPLPTRSTKTMIFRRYNALDPTPNELQEGVTPSGKKLTKTDVAVTLKQVGDYVGITDVVDDTHEDPVLQEMTTLLGDQAAQMLELMRLGVLRGGTNVFYANGTGRAEVNTRITRALQRRIVRALDRQYAKPITRVVRSTPNYGTQAVAPSYICLCPTDVEGDVRDLEGFVSVENYGNISPYPTEIGKVERVRYLTAPMLKPFADAGGPAGAMLSTGGERADVYPCLFLGANAYATVPLKGKKAVTPMVLNPNKPRGGDNLGQRGSVGWKTYTNTVILNDAWLVRAEVAVTN
ncbi:MAG: N4-gp56 family major capsid protein [Desulfovibrio sp.]|jgi:N4-gp56 family major capsid protein